MTADQTIEQVASPNTSTAPAQTITPTPAAPAAPAQVVTPTITPPVQPMAASTPVTPTPVAVTPPLQSIATPAPANTGVAATRTVTGKKEHTTGNMSSAQITSGSAHTPTHKAGTGYVPGCVRLVNLTSTEINIILRGSVQGPHLLPFSKKWDAHISAPIPKKYTKTPAIENLQATGQIAIVEVTP